MSMFGLDHLSPLEPDQITAGRTPSTWDQIQQGWTQQFRVDSQEALQEEVRNRWLENIERFRERTGVQLEAPDGEMGLDSYSRYLDKIEGREQGWLDQFDLAGKAGEQRLEQADLSIRQLNDPSLKSFADIVKEVYAMQAETEAQTARMAQAGGAGGVVGQFIGAAGGSFSTRDPINVISLPVGGGGRTVAMRILSEMAVGGVATAASETFVQENRDRAGLQERSMLFDVAAGAVGAGVFRGLFEGVAAGVRALPASQRAAAIRELEQMEFDARDTALRAMLETQPQSPRARAGVAMLDEAQDFEASNPYGTGPEAEARFRAELAEVAAVIGGRPMTGIAQALPPIPAAVIDTITDFRLVKEQSPKVWARLEEAKAASRALDDQISSGTTVPKVKVSRDNPGGDWLERKQAGALRAASETPETVGMNARGLHGSTTATSRVRLPISALRDLEGVLGEKPAAGQVKFDELSQSVSEKGFQQDGAVMVWINHLGQPYIYEGNNRIAVAALNGVEDLEVEIQWRNGAEGVEGPLSLQAVKGLMKPEPLTPAAVKQLRNQRVEANQRYAAAYKEVEAEAAKLNRAQAIITGQAQKEAVDLLGYPTSQKPFLGPITRHDIVEARVEQINQANERIAEQSDRIAAAVVDDATGLVDIGLKTPVPADFKIPFDDGDMTVAQVLDEFVEDDLLDEAMRTCLI